MSSSFALQEIKTYFFKFAFSKLIWTNYKFNSQNFISFLKTVIKENLKMWNIVLKVVQDVMMTKTLFSYANSSYPLCFHLTSLSMRFKPLPWFLRIRFPNKLQKNWIMRSSLLSRSKLCDELNNTLPPSLFIFLLPINFSTLLPLLQFITNIFAAQFFYFIFLVTQKCLCATSPTKSFSI